MQAQKARWLFNMVDLRVQVDLPADPAEAEMQSVKPAFSSVGSPKAGGKPTTPKGTTSGATFSENGAHLLPLFCPQLACNVQSSARLVQSQRRCRHTYTYSVKHPSCHKVRCRELIRVVSDGRSLA